MSNPDTPGPTALSAEQSSNAEANWDAFVSSVASRLRALERDPGLVLEEVRGERRLTARIGDEASKPFGFRIPNVVLGVFWRVGDPEEAAAEFVEGWTKACRRAEEFASRTKLRSRTTGPVLTEAEWRWLYTRPFPTPAQIAKRFDGQWLKLFAAFSDRPRGVSDETPPISPAIVSGHLISVLNAAVAHCNTLASDDEAAELLFSAIAATREWQAELTRYLPPPMPPRWGGANYIIG